MPTTTSANSKRKITGLDRKLANAVGAVTSHGPPSPTRILTAIRRTAVDEALSTHGATPVAAADLARHAADTLDEMRSRVADHARSQGALCAAAARGDARWRDCDSSEYLDDPALDSHMRTRIMESLDYFNEMMSSYERFFDELVPLLRPTGTTRILDLAAGHGGFALAAARSAARRGLDVHVTASDLKPEYLAMGRERAVREGLDVDFVVQDALDLSNLEPGQFDLIICMQSPHHFPPGLVSVMFKSAARAATRGVVFIDACRSLLAASFALLFGTLRLRNLGWVHDAWISTRRAYVPEELELLARVGVRDGVLESEWMPPSHCLLRWRPDKPVPCSDTTSAR